MNKPAGLFSSSLGRKVVMGITGLFLCSFLIVHLIGNLALFTENAQQSFNEYTLFMTTNPLIRISELILFAGLLLHIIDAVLLTLANKKARPIQYAMDKKKSSWYSRNMGITGSLILAFLVLHLATFFVAYKFDPEIAKDPHGLKDMYTIVITAFKQPWYSIVYIICIIVLGFHLNHGFQSAFQTLGINHSKYTPMIKKIGSGFAIVMTIGFLSFPIILGFIN
ncbi:MAG: succinate dehydrogenase cytochrome b subunit [Flavobacteriales bacterium]